MFVGVHVALAMRTNTPELMIEPDEAKAFMKAAQNVMRHYDVRANQKTLDWLAFAGVVGSMYGTRAFAIAARRSAERAAHGPRETGQVLRWPVTPKARPEAPQAPPVTTPAANMPQDVYVPSVPAEFAGAEEFGDFPAG